jgi:ubiquinone/menaquinone biosynthesis C-methylase UbiE
MTIIEKQLIKSYHIKRLHKWGDNRSKILGWTSDDAQKIRFNVITSRVNFNNVSLLDLGCGDGDFKCFLDKQFSNFDYIGIDQQPEFITYAKQRFKDQSNTWFYHTDFEHCQLPNVDIVVACGSLSYRCSNPDYYMKRIEQFYKAANDTFIFNMLDEEGFESGPLLVSHNKEQIYKQCQEICSHVTLETGYLNNDFTIRMQKG